MAGLVLQIFGAMLVAFVLLDVFLTVLVARIGTSILSERIMAATWWILRQVAYRAGRFREQILTSAGPLGLLLVIVTWLALLTVGFGMIAFPAIGSTISSTDGPTPPRQFSTAIYFMGSAMTTVGSGTLSPQSPFMRWLVFLGSAVGITMFTLTLTYLNQIYNALLQRNALAMTLHFATSSTGDAARWVCRLGNAGDFQGASSELGQIADRLTHVYESHHFYPSVVFFRFSEMQYAVARSGLIMTEVVTLLRAALDERYAHFKNCSGVDQLWSCSMYLLNDLAPVYLPKSPAEGFEPDPPTLARWRERLNRAMALMSEAGIAVVADESVAFEHYVASRKLWDRYLVSFAEYLDQKWPDVAPAEYGIARPH